VLATLDVVKNCPPSNRRPAPVPTPAAALPAVLAAVLISSCFGATFAHADSAIAGAAPLPKAVREQAQALAQQAAAALAPPGARIVATAGALDPRLRLAPCDKIEPHLVAGLPSWGTTRVGLRCSGGAGGAAWRVYLPMQVQVLAPAWVSKAALPQGALVVADQWELAETDWAAGPPPLGATATIAGRTLVRPLAAGQALRESDLQARRWFASGEPVSIVTVGEGYSIRTEGQALGPGMEGQPVRVRTEAGRILSGQAVGVGLVEVRL
jgi:flagella basal body P-ring formation protein FlgA